jgi:hypothetical protein
VTDSLTLVDGFLGGQVHRTVLVKMGRYVDFFGVILRICVLEASRRHFLEMP